MAKKRVPAIIKLEDCPFIEGLEIEVYVKGTSETRINPSNIRNNGGVITSVGVPEFVYRRWAVEKDNRVETYTSYKGGSLEEFYNRLGREAYYMLGYIQRNCLRENKLYFYMDAIMYEDATRSKRTTFWRAKKDLIENGFIAECNARGWYWINPKFAFKGVRSKTDELKDNVIIVTNKPTTDNDDKNKKA
jgi:hypothetical protein